MSFHIKAKKTTTHVKCKVTRQPAADRLIFNQDFKQFVSDIKFYGLHCLRSGGATSTCNFGVPDRLFKRHGRWRSENVKDGYVKDSFYDLLL
jgi:hypothetical protein